MDQVIILAVGCVEIVKLAMFLMNNIVKVSKLSCVICVACGFDNFVLEFNDLKRSFK